MIKHIFFLIIPSLLIVTMPLAYGDIGRNFDLIDNGDGTVTWKSHYDRILDPTWKYVNYILDDKPTVLEFRSANISFDFDKDLCTLKLYDPKNDRAVFPTFVTELRIDNVPIPSVVCNVLNIVEDTDGISFTVDKSGYDIIYDVHASGETEWTYIGDTALADGTYTIIEKCVECDIGTLRNGLIDFGTYVFDTKNDVHGAVKDIQPATCKSRTGLACPSNGSNTFNITYEQVVIAGNRLDIDPTAVLAINDRGYAFSNSGTGANCLAASGQTLSINPITRKPGDAVVDRCYLGLLEFDISSLPNSGTLITDIKIESDITASPTIPSVGCDFIQMTTYDLSSVGHPTLWDEVTNGTIYLAADSICNSAAVNRQSAHLGPTAVTDLTTHISTDDLFTVGVTINDYDNRAAGAVNTGAGWANNELIVTYTMGDAITDLTATSVRARGVDLSWSAPVLISGTIDGYQVNRTSPHNENVNIVVINNTETTATTYTVTDLIGSTQYSFRVGYWLTTIKGNMSGNVLNITTAFDPTAGFTPGTFNFTATGSDDRPIIFERNDINENDLFLNITVDTDWNLACNFHYKFANINKTYTNIANTTIDAETDAVGFRFDDVDNEIIDVLCWDQYTNASGTYLITQNVFPFLQNIIDFRDGDFGTQGMFGAIDMITLVAVILGMVGFNRANESVGGIFLIFIMGGLAYFEIISWPAVMTAGLVLALIVIIGSTRKD